jgi:hypothetical protein
MKGFDSVHAASESRALPSFLLKPSVTQFDVDSFPVGITVHNRASLMELSLTMFPVVHHASVRSDAQNTPSLFAEVQKLDCNGNSVNKNLLFLCKIRENSTF